MCTGGEPLLQLDAALIEALHAAGFEVAVETNGTQAAPAGLVADQPKPELAVAAAETPSAVPEPASSDLPFFGRPPDDPGVKPVKTVAGKQGFKLF